MKYDADLQEIDARLDARGTCTRKRVEHTSRSREMRKRTVAGQRPWRAKNWRRRRARNIYAGDYIMLPMPRERELFVLRLAEKSEPLLPKHVLEWLSTGSPVLSSDDGEGRRNIRMSLKSSWLSCARSF